MTTIHDRYPHLATTYGWLYDDTAQLTEDLLRFQTASGLTGDILEIGVYLGRYFILLAKNLAPGEVIHGVDIFESEKPRLYGSANATYENLMDILDREIPGEMDSGRVLIYTADSIQFATTRLAEGLEGSCRFVSIDGSHDAMTVGSDLELADRLLMPGGLVALDDINDDVPQQWPGVREAWTAYEALHEGDDRRLREVARIPNKLIACNRTGWTDEYREMLEAQKIGALGKSIVMSTIGG